MSQRKVETTAKDLSQMLQAIQTKLKDEHADMLKLLAKKEENQSRLPGAKRKGRKKEMFALVEPPPYSDHFIHLDVEAVEAPQLYVAKDRSTFKSRMSAVVARANMRLEHYAARRVDNAPQAQRLGQNRSAFIEGICREKLLRNFAKFSYEAGEYDDQIEQVKRKLHQKATSDRVQLTAGEKVLYESILKGKKTGADIALKYATVPPRKGSLTCTPEGFRAGLALIMPNLNQLLSKEDAFILHKITVGNAILLTELLRVGDEIYLPSKLNPGQMKRIICWGGGREDVGLMKLRSAGFEAPLKFDEIPSKLSYGYSKSILAPPEDWNPKEIDRSFKPPNVSMTLKSVHGFRGDFICKNVHYISPSEEGEEGMVAYAVAALIVVQNIEGGRQMIFDRHDDDVTCLTVEKGGAVRRAASGQMGGGEGVCVNVWSVASQKLLYKCGVDFLQRQVQAVAFGGETEKGGGSKFLVAVGGDNNQTMGVFDLKAAAQLAADNDSDETVSAPLLGFCSMDKLPGALPTVYGLGWMNNSEPKRFVSLAQGKSLKWWDMIEGGTNDAGTPNTINQFKKGVPPRGAKEITCMEWSSYDCKYLITGTDISLIIWPGGGGEALQVIPMRYERFSGIWGIDVKVLDRGTMEVFCGCGDSSVRMLSLTASAGSSSGSGSETKENKDVDGEEGGEGEKEKEKENDKPPPTPTAGKKEASDGTAKQNPFNVNEFKGVIDTTDYMLPDTVVDPTPNPLGESHKISLTKHPNESNWGKVRHVCLTPSGVLAGKSGGTLFHITTSSFKATPIAGGHAESVRGVASNAKWTGGENEVAYATCGNDQLVCFWRETEAKQDPLPIMRVRVGHKACGIAFSSDDSLMAVGCADGFVKIFGMGQKKAPSRSSSRAGSRTGPLKNGKRSSGGKVSPSGRVSPHGKTSPTSFDPPLLIKKPKPLPLPFSPPTFLVEHHTFKEDVDCVSFSPSSSLLACGSHSNVIDIFSTLKRGFPPIKRLRGHTSYITSLNWSLDGQCLQSTCGAGEILHYNIKESEPRLSKLITSQSQARTIMIDGGSRHMDLNDHECWESWSCILGFPVMGIWPDYSDGTDVNSVHVDEGRKYVVTADDFGGVKCFNFPCVVEDAEYVRVKGHSSHVSGVRFLEGCERVVSTGSNDRACLVWRFKDLDDESKKIREEKIRKDDDESLIPPSQLKLIENYGKMSKIEEDKKLRRSLADPFTSLRNSMTRKGEGVDVNPEVRREVEIMSMFLTEFMKGYGSEDVVKSLRDSGIKLESETVDNVDNVDNVEEKKINDDVKVEQFGINYCEATGYDVSYEELKGAGEGMYEIEYNERKDRRNR
ncbi:hypothetical protein TrVE_jg12112 [Triparma verrucosa]|uniref:EML-like second beta-propeller domain-containing protein n=1 Tax=Triparma verrucosa TaxID=1606542 RepID=A0A9W7CB99_9STRA|nr:hypothetical protein TrVE_jg12112 [Triparma verrucosa]